MIRPIMMAGAAIAFGASLAGWTGVLCSLSGLLLGSGTLAAILNRYDDR